LLSILSRSEPFGTQNVPEGKFENITSVLTKTPIQIKPFKFGQLKVVDKLIWGWYGKCFYVFALSYQ